MGEQIPTQMIDMWECKRLLGLLGAIARMFQPKRHSLPDFPLHWSAPSLPCMLANAYEGDVCDGSGDGESDLPRRTHQAERRLLERRPVRRGQ